MIWAKARVFLFFFKEMSMDSVGWVLVHTYVLTMKIINFKSIPQTLDVPTQLTYEY